MAGWTGGNFGSYGGNMANVGNSGGTAGQMMLVPIQNEQVVNTYLVGAGQTVALVDWNSGFLWLKSTAANSVPMQVRKFRVEEIIEQPQQADAVSREEFDDLKKSMNDVTQALAGITAMLQQAAAPAPATTKGGKSK